MNLEEIKAARAIGEIAYSNELEWLIAEVERLKPFEHEYICKKCGLRQNSNQEPPTF